MANDKKFIVKNGLLTGENVVIGDTLDRSTGRLQVKHDSGSDAARFDGRVIFDHDVANQGAIEITNDAGSGIIAKFSGAAGGDLRLTDIGTGDYFLAQSNQNNGIKFYDGNDGVEILYSNSVDLEFDSSGIDFKRAPSVNGDAIWYAGNDGSGSGLDADLLDGLDSLQFLRSDEDDTMNGSLIITGDLTVQGTTTYIDTTQLLVSDNIFTLNADFTTGTPTENAGMEIRRGDSANSSLLWDESNDWFKLISAGTDLGRIITTADEGSGNGFDADTVDGLEAAQFLRSDADDTATGNLTFDGDIIIDQQIIHKGDADTYLDFNAANEFQIVTGGASRLQVNNSYVLANNEMRSPRFVDQNNTSYYGDFASTSIMSRIDLDDYIRHNGDVDTYFGFDAADSYGVWTGGTARLAINNTNAIFYYDVQADRFVDKDATGYYAQPGDNSVFHALGLDDDLFHNGDTDTKLSFADNDISLQTGGAERLGIDNTSVRSSVNVYGPAYYDSNNNNYYGDFDSISQMNGIDIDAWIRHRGNTTTYFGFPSNNVFRVYTNNAQRFQVDNDSADFTVNVYAPRYYDSDNAAYYVDPAGDSQMNTIDIDDFVRHRGDTDTYVGFNASDQFQIVTGGSERFRINNTSALITVPLTSTASNGLVIADYIVHSGDTNTYFGFDTTDSISFVTNGTEKLGIDTDSIETTVNFGVNKVPTAALSVQTAATMGNNPYASGNIFADFGDAGTVDFSIRGTASARDVWMVHDGDGDIVFADTGATVTLGINTGSQDVVIGDQNPTYTDGGDNTALTATPSNAKLHVNGSIYLNGANDGIIFGRGTASFLKDEELAFGWGGGLYMTDATYLRIRNNKAVYSTGDYYGSRFYAQAATGYYLDPDSTSVLNRIGIDDRIFHNGDTDTYMEFDAADNFRIVTGNGERLDINNTRVLANNQMHSPIFYDSNNTAYYGDFNSTSNMSRIDIDDYIRHRGDLNTYIGFDGTDQFSVYTNGIKRVQTDATQTRIRNKLYVYGAQASSGDAALFQSNANGSGVTIRMSDQNSGENVAPSQSGTIGFYHSDNAINPDSNAAFYFRTTEPKSHFIFGSDSDGSGTTAANYVALVPDVNNVGWVGRADRRWGNIYGVTGNYSGNVTAVDMYANRYYDANNNAFYGDFASTSIMNTVRVNRLEVDSSAHFIDIATGDYGTIRVQGNRNSWAGYAINDDWVFMADGATNAGIYNDTDNEWALRTVRNAGTDLYYNGSVQLETENGYGYARNQMRSPIFYDSNDTNYFGDFASRSRFNTLELGNQGALTGSTSYPLGIYHNNRYQIGFRNSGAGTNYVWLVHDNYNYNGYGSVDSFIVHFNGIGDKLYLTEQGNMLVTGEMSAANYNLSGGNENISLNPAYGSGMADQTLFDGTMYWEKRVIQNMQGAENISHQTSEFVKNNNGPFSSTYALRLNRYEVFDSDYIEVEPGEELYGEVAVRYISGSGGVVYMGVRRYDKDKRPIAGNDGITYFVVGGNNYTGTGWNVFSGHTTIPTSHTVYNGSDGGACKYVRVILLMNYPSGGGPATREYGPPVLKRTRQHSNIRTTQNMFAARYYDADNTGFYVDPASTSIMNRIDASSFYDRDNTARFMNPNSGGNVQGSWNWNNGSIENLNNLSFNDPGPQEGIRWKGGNEWKIYESPNNLSTNTGGNLQFTSGSGAGTMRFRVQSTGDTYAGRYSYAQRFYDSDNGSYYLDPASTSNIVRLDADEINVDGGNRNNANDATIYVTATNNNDWGMVINKNRSSATEYGLDVRMGASHTYGMRLLAGGTERWRLNNSYGQHWGSLRAPIFYDQNDTGYYLDPAATSRLEKIRFEGTDEAIELNSGNPYIRWMENGTDRFYIQWRGSYDAPLFRNQQGDNFDFMPDGNGGAVALRLKGADDDIWGYVYASDSEDIGFLDDQGQWAIRHNRDSWTYFYINNSLRAYVDTGSFQHVTSIRSPIFYDRDDTNYYGDFAGTSIMNTVRGNRFEVESSGRYIDVPSGNYGSIRVEGTSGGWAGYAIRDDWVLMSSGAGVVGLYNDTNNEWSQLWYQNSYTELHFNGTWEERSASGYMYARGSYRAPIFYDSNDTNFYADPNSTSRFRRLTITENLNGYLPDNFGRFRWNTGYFNDGSSTANFITDLGQNEHLAQGFTAHKVPWSYAGNSDVNTGIQTIEMAGSALATWHDGSYYTTLVIRPTTGAGGGSVYIYNNQGSSYSPGWRQVWTSATDNFNYSSIRSPIFYDINNTGYYVDPASTSQLYRLDVNNQLRFESGAPAYFYTSSGNLRGYIRATESNDNHFEFATSGGEDIIFRDGGFGGDWNQIIRGNGQVLISSRLDVPIMYDRNDTGYYVDPAGFSNLGSGLRGNEIYARGWFRNDSSGGGLYNQATAMHWYADANWRWRLYSTTNTAAILFTTSGNNARGYVYADNSNNIGFLNQGGGWSLRTNNSTIEAYGNFYANIMYDRNNTGYYINPNGNSRLDSINANSIKTSSSPEYGQYYIDTGGASYPTGRNQIIGRGLAIYADYNGGSGKPWTYDMAASFNLGGRAFEFSVDWISTNSTGLKIRSLRDCCQNWSSWTDVATSGRSFTNSIDLRAPIFYDSNNTGFYVNPNGTSRMSTIEWDRLNAADRGDFITFYGNNSDYHGIASRNSGGGADDDIRINSYGNVFVNLDSNNNNGTQYLYVGRHGAGTGSIQGWYFQAGDDGNTYASSSFRAPIFYDRNNTGYYVDPSSFSNFNTGVRANEFYARNWFRNDNSGEGIYNQSTGQHFYSDNDDYWNVAGGSAANGIRFRDEYGGTVRGYVYADNGNNVGILNSGGSWRMRIVSGDYGLFNGSSVRAPIFYDSNDTAFRFNGASNHDTRFRGVHHETMAYMSLPGHTRDSGEYYRARPRITSDSNYWTGAMGWGKQDMTATVADWGSGFIDSWSNPANQPSGTSHWVGVQAYHYSNGSARYGWQMVGGPIGNLRFRNTWSSFSSWRTVPILDVNSSNGGSMYAGRYYDSNDTAYYMDPASTSRTNVINSNQYTLNNGWDIFDDDSDTLSIRSSDNDHGEVRFLDNNTYCGRIYWDDDGSIFSLYHDNGEAILYADEDYITYLYYNGTWEGRTRSGYFEARGSFRAPIFYDQNDTFYYTNPAGTSRINAIQAYGVIQSDEDIQAFVSYSDVRWKENIKVIENAVDKVKQLDGITYNYIDREGEYTGVIAQQVEKVLPGIVVDSTDLKTGKDRKTVRYGNMVGLFIESTKEQQVQIEEQQEQINRQQEQIDNQQKTIDKLENMIKMLMEQMNK